MEKPVQVCEVVMEDVVRCTSRCSRDMTSNHYFKSQLILSSICTKQYRE